MSQPPGHAPAGQFAGLDLNPFAVDWLRDALNGKIPADHDKIVYIRRKSGQAVFDGPPPADYPGRW